jgi:type I restriction enzyme S subunit
MNNLPKGWTETTLGEIIILVGGGTPKTTNKKFWNGGIPWLSVVDFNNNNRWVSHTDKNITEYGLINSSTKILKKGDLIISARGTVGALAQLSKNMTFNQSCYGIKEKDNTSNINFLYYLIKYNSVNISKNTHGTVFDTITKLTFDNIQVKIPKLKEQKTIADILSSFDNKIELLNEQNKTLETMAQAIFKEWFVKFNYPNATGEMIDSEIGKIPKNWKIGKIKDVANLKSGYAFKSKDFVDVSNHKALKIKDLKGNGKVDISNIASIDNGITNIERVKYFKLSQGDIVLAMSGNTTGKIGIIPKLINDVYLNQRVGKFFFKDNKYRNFLYVYLMANNFEKKILNMGYGSAQPNINPSQIEDINTIQPDEIIFDTFIKIINPIYEKIHNNNWQIQTLQNTRDTLLPKLMSGKLRVKGFEN